MKYIMLHHDFLEATEALSDAERGRLIAAMIGYARDGVAGEAALTGNERFLFPVFRRQIDRDALAYDTRVMKNTANGKKGGRPRKPEETEKNPSVSDKTEKRQEEEEEKEEDEEEYKEEYEEKEEEKDKEKEPGRGGAAAPRAPALNEVLDFIRENGLSVNGETFWNFYQAVGWRAGRRPIRDWRAQLRVWAARERNAPPAARAAPVAGGASTRADNPALNYAQRDYVDDDSFFIDLDAYAGGK